MTTLVLNPAVPDSAIPAEVGDATHLVVYTDGGCRPSRGIGGWGVHGYFFKLEPAKQGAGIPTALPTEKGYAMGKGGKPEISLTAYVDAFGSLIPESTNNIAELTANKRALEIALQTKVKHLHLIMDSTYVMQGFEQWIETWAASKGVRGDGTPTANQPLWEAIYGLKRLLLEAGVEITTGWVKGHSGNLGNDRADIHATRAIFAGRNHLKIDEITFTDAKGYWTSKNDRNRMFSHPNWYFGTQSENGVLSHDGRHIYYLGDPREDDEMTGKKISNATFSILYLKEAEPVLEKVRQTMQKLERPQYQGLTIGYLSTIFAKERYDEILSFGCNLMTLDGRTQRIVDRDDKTMIARELHPARLAFNAINVLQTLEQLLLEYLQPREGSLLKTTDITGLMYEQDASKKTPVVKLKSDITSTLRSIDVSAGYATGAENEGVTKLVLTLSQDLPDRNTLAALAGEQTKVTLLTWPESPRAIRYATVIEADGDVGIWSGVYANLHMLAS